MKKRPAITQLKILPHFTTLLLFRNKARTGPRSAARFKLEGLPRRVPQKSTPEVHPEVN